MRPQLNALNAKLFSPTSFPAKGDRFRNQTSLRCSRLPQSRRPEATTLAPRQRLTTSCPACGGLVAFDAPACPHCGKKSPAPSPKVAGKSKPVRKSLLVTLGAILLLAWVGSLIQPPSERGSSQASGVSPEVQFAVQAAVKHAGYRCDELNAVVRHVFASGYRVSCNGYRYAYSIEDRGGRWVVTVD